MFDAKRIAEKRAELTAEGEPVVRAHRSSLLDHLAIGTFVVTQMLGWYAVGQSVPPWETPTRMILLGWAGILAWLVADFSSGLVHYVADNWGSPQTPVLGPLFIAPFREHHKDPLAMLKHGPSKRNGNNSLIVLPLCAWVPLCRPEGEILGWLASLSLLIGLWTAFTNQIHAWAHMSQPPYWVRPLQRWGVLLSPGQHALHHQPFAYPVAEAAQATDYCITSGFCDRLYHQIASWRH